MGWFSKTKEVPVQRLSVQGHKADVASGDSGKPHANIMRHVTRVRRIDEALERPNYPDTKKAQLRREKKKIIGWLGLTEEQFEKVFKDA